MLFNQIRNAFLQSLRVRVRNGELTERNLAKLVGISQPHVHNVLKGIRTLSPDALDRCLAEFGMSILDVVDSTVLEAHLNRQRGGDPIHTWLPVVEGRLGPGHPWPVNTERSELFPVPFETVRRMGYPVVARLAGDVQMIPLFGEGDLALLDQSHKVRSQFEANALYAVKRGESGILRRIRTVGRTIFLVSEDCIDRPALWERLPAEGHFVAHFIRARAVLVAREAEWKHRN